jgi:hypothetical protein
VLTFSVELSLDPVSVDPAASVTSLLGYADQLASRFATGLPQEQGIHGALQADGEFLDISLRDRADGYAQKS